jgi:hypothetical protein
MGSRRVTACGSCGSRDLENVLQLTPTPPTCAMLKVGDRTEQATYPLELLRCAACTLVQLSCIVDPGEVFPAGYPYSSGNSGALRAHFAALAGSMSVDPSDLVVDVGGNDGTFLSNLDCRRLLIDPTDQILKAPEGVTGRQGFFGLDMARAMRAEFGPARYVTAFNVLAHVAHPHDFLEGVWHLLADGGVFITENGALQAIMTGGWDFIYHEHLRYYDERSLESLLAHHGFVPVEHEALEVHGGSFRTRWMIGRRDEPRTVKSDESWRRDFKRLREDIKRNRWYVRSLVSTLGGMGERVGAVGATARATTLLNLYGFDATDIEAVYELSTSDKIGHYIPGTDIPVIDEAALAGPDAPENMLLLLWYMEDQLVPKLRSLGYDGNIIVPLPKWHEFKPQLAAA